MTSRRRATTSGLTLALGVVLGWTLAHIDPPRLSADRSEPGQQDLVASGPVSIEHNPGLKIQVAHDAIYYLDYRGGRLLAAVPTPRQSAGGTQMLDSFAERDLVADFNLTPGGANPRFLMTTGTLGALNGAWAPLYVFETSSRRVATYRVEMQSVGVSTKPRFDLLEVRSLPPIRTASAPR